MLPNKTVDIFTKIQLQFKIDDKLESEVKENVFTKHLNISRFGGVIFTLNLTHNIGNIVQIQLYSTEDKWVFLSEISFESSNKIFS